MRHNLKSVVAGVLLAGFLALVFPLSAHADNPGDPCTNADPSPAVQLGDGRIIVCNGTVWKSVMDITNNGQSSVQVENDPGACNSDKLGRLRYDDALDTWQYCDGTNWADLLPSSGNGAPYQFSFTNLTEQGISTLVTSEIVPISGFTGSLAVSIAGDGSPQFQICNTYNCSSVDHAWGNTAQSIDSGQYLQLRHTTSAAASTTTNVVITVGTAIVSWRATTTAPRTVFVTSSTHTGATVGGLSGADNICQSLAGVAGLSGTYKAWLTDSDTNNSPTNRFPHTNTIYQLTNGTKIADGWTDLTDGSLDAAISYNESATSVGSVQVWTNTTTAGAYGGANHCASWTSTTGNGNYGTSGSTGSQWTSQSSLGCVNSARLYCFQTSTATSSSSSSVTCTGLSFAGYTASTYTGNLGGTKGANDKCDAAYSGSRAMTYEDWLTLGTDYPYTYSAWLVDGSYYDGGSLQRTRDGRNSDGTGAEVMCTGWTGSGSGEMGPYIQPSVGGLTLAACNNTARLPCVYNN